MYLVYIIALLSLTLAGTVILLYVLWKLCRKHEVKVTPEDAEAIIDSERKRMP